MLNFLDTSEGPFLVSGPKFVGFSDFFFFEYLQKFKLLISGGYTLLPQTFDPSVNKVRNSIDHFGFGILIFNLRSDLIFTFIHF